MDIKAAIEYLENSVDEVRNYGDSVVIEYAISALQEQYNRRNGCDFCKTYDFGKCGIRDW